MGVHGLWKLIDSAGKPIPVEALENKVLAIDVSIWLYQLVRGFQESSGKPVHSAFLLGLFHRICKLLFYRIKPIFVFDGGVPSLKKKTIAARQKNRDKAGELNEKLRQQLLENLIKQQALGNIIGEDVIIPKILAKTKDELFKLPPVAEDFKKEIEEESSSEDEKTNKYGNLHEINVQSEEFLALPPDIRHDILTELKETRKQNSWAKVHLMPEESMEFSTFQMGRLLKRRAVQEGLEHAEEELGSRGFTISDLQTLLTEQGIDLSQRIASDNTTRFIYSTSSDPKIRQKIINKHTDPDNLSKISEEEEINELESSSFQEFSQDSEEENVEYFQEEYNKDLTQDEILKLIKDSDPQDGPSTSKKSRLDIPPENYILSPVKNDAQNDVNDHPVEHGKNPEKDNKCLKLDHENLPRTDSYCQDSTMLQKDSPLSYNQLEENTPTKNILHILPQINSQVPISEETLNKTSKQETSDEGSDDDFLEVEEDEKPMEIVIEPNESLNDDMFADIFKPENISHPKETDKINKTEKPSMEIVIKPKESLDDDMFADIFKPENISHPKETDKINKTEKPSMEIVEPKQSLDDDCFQSQNDISQPDKMDFQNNPGPSNNQDNENSTKPNFETALKLSEELNVNDTSKLAEQVLNLEEKSEKLAAEAKRGERMAQSITEQITTDAQELLQLFGIPYITAPMEAEAQCAYLDFSGQTDGTITDDSDIWLFGANNVYKNFFDQKKFVKQFKADDINRFYKLKRDDLIMIAMLVGSDYTVGIRGVGPVNAIEIVAHFPPKKEASTPDERLRVFRDAYRNSRLNANLLKKLKSLQFTDGFPSSEIVKAYCLPRIDDSKEKFKWSEPDVEAIKQFTSLKLGWDFKKTMLTLNPILDKLKQKTTQKTMHNYFNWAFDKDEQKLSKRVSKAVDIMKTGVVPSPPKVFKKGIAPNQIKTKKKEEFGECSKVIKSKTPAQVARERAAKKLKEIRKRDQNKKSKK